MRYFILTLALFGAFPIFADRTATQQWVSNTVNSVITNDVENGYLMRRVNDWFINGHVIVTNGYSERIYESEGVTYTAKTEKVECKTTDVYDFVTNYLPHSTKMTQTFIPQGLLTNDTLVSIRDLRGDVFNVESSCLADGGIKSSSFIVKSLKPLHIQFKETGDTIFDATYLFDYSTYLEECTTIVMIHGTAIQYINGRMEEVKYDRYNDNWQVTTNIIKTSSYSPHTVLTNSVDVSEDESGGYIFVATNYFSSVFTTDVYDFLTNYIPGNCSYTIQTNTIKSLFADQEMTLIKNLRGVVFRVEVERKEAILYRTPIYRQSSESIIITTPSPFIRKFSTDETGLSNDIVLPSSITINSLSRNGGNPTILSSFSSEGPVYIESSKAVEKIGVIRKNTWGPSWYTSRSKVSNVYSANGKYYHNATGELYRVASTNGVIVGVGGQWKMIYRDVAGVDPDSVNRILTPDSSCFPSNNIYRWGSTYVLDYNYTNGEISVDGDIKGHCASGIDPTSANPQFPEFTLGSSGSILKIFKFDPHKIGPINYDVKYDRFATTNDVAKAIKSCGGGVTNRIESTDGLSTIYADGKWVTRTNATAGVAVTNTISTKSEVNKKFDSSLGNNTLTWKPTGVELYSPNDASFTVTKNTDTRESTASVGISVFGVGDKLYDAEGEPIGETSIYIGSGATDESGKAYIDYQNVDDEDSTRLYLSDIATTNAVCNIVTAATKELYEKNEFDIWANSSVTVEVGKVSAQAQNVQRRLVEIYGDDVLRYSIAQRILPQMTHKMSFRTKTPPNALNTLDIVIDWGDGTRTNASDIVWIKGVNYDHSTGTLDDTYILFSHTYTQEGRYTVRVYGDNYFNLRHYANKGGIHLTDDTYNLVCGVALHDGSVASRKFNASGMFMWSSRLLAVSASNRFTPFTNIGMMFANCKNLNYFSGTFGSDVNASPQLFQNCDSLVNAYADIPVYRMTTVSSLFENSANAEVNIGRIILRPFMADTVNVYHMFRRCRSLNKNGTVQSRYLWEDTGVNWDIGATNYWWSKEIGMQYTTGDIINHTGGSYVALRDIIITSTSLAPSLSSDWQKIGNSASPYAVNVNGPFAGCPAEIRRQVPILWGGSNTNIVIKPYVGRKRYEDYIEAAQAMTNGCVQAYNPTMTRYAKWVDSNVEIGQHYQYGDFASLKLDGYDGVIRNVLYPDFSFVKDCNGKDLQTEILNATNTAMAQAEAKFLPMSDPNLGSSYKISWEYGTLNLSSGIWFYPQRTTISSTDLHIGDDNTTLESYLANGDWNTATDPFAKASAIPTAASLSAVTYASSANDTAEKILSTAANTAGTISTNVFDISFNENADYALTNLTAGALSLRSGEIGNYTTAGAAFTLALDFSAAAGRSGDCLLYVANTGAADATITLTPNTYTYVATDIAKARTLTAATTNIVSFTRVKADTILVSKIEVK